MGHIKYYILMFCVALMSSAVSAVNGDNPELFINYEVTDHSVYECQPVPVIVTLYSTTPDIAYAEKSAPFSLRKGEFATFKNIEPAGNAYRKVIDGKTFYCFPLEAFMVSFDEKGAYEMAPRDFNVGVSFPVVVNDPFWGRIRSSEVRDFTVPVGKCNFKVKSLPSPPADFEFSGSVGEFSVETVLPPGNIYLNEEATAYVVLRGTGMLAERTMPEYRDAFKNGMKLKSVSESRSELFDDGKLISEIRLECTFIPVSSENVEIGEVFFSYFDPVSGKYQTAKSNPVKVEVKSSVSKREKISI